MVLSRFDWPCCVFVWVKNPHPFLPRLNLTLTHIVYVKHKHMHVVLYLWSAPPSGSQLIFKFWFSRAARSPHPSPLLHARHSWKTRQTRAPDKQLEDSFSEAACRHGHTHLALTRKGPLRPLHLLYFPRLSLHLFCVGSHYFISPPPCTGRICARPALESGVPRVPLSLAQRR